MRQQGLHIPGLLAPNLTILDWSHNRSERETPNDRHSCAWSHLVTTSAVWPSRWSQRLWQSAMTVKESYWGVVTLQLQLQYVGQCLESDTCWPQLHSSVLPRTPSRSPSYRSRSRRFSASSAMPEKGLTWDRSPSDSTESTPAWTAPPVCGSAGYTSWGKIQPAF